VVNLIDGLTATASKVVNLIGKLERKGYHIFVDNLYNSLALSRYVWQHFGCYMTGTYRRNYGLPHYLLNNAPRAKGEITAVHVAPRGRGAFSAIFCAIWDTKLFFFLSSWLYPLHFVANRNNKMKFVGVNAYNNSKNAVDRFDQMVDTYSLYVKSIKWWKRLFFYLIDVTLVNMYMIAKAYKSDLTRLAFHQQLAAEILQQHDPQLPIVADTNGHLSRTELRHESHNSHVSSAAVLHAPMSSGRFDSGGHPRCAKCKRRSSIMCGKCRAVLCPGDCWKQWHSK